MRDELGVHGSYAAQRSRSPARATDAGTWHVACRASEWGVLLCVMLSMGDAFDHIERCQDDELVSLRLNLL